MQEEKLLGVDSSSNLVAV